MNNAGSAVSAIQRLLIANRGEIACRVIATCRRLGIESVAVYSDADRNARHVRLADRAEYIGPAPAAESYLNVAAVLKAAQQSSADAIHPGYGFLSENARFADAVGKAGLIFVGPPADAIRAMGSKSASKKLMEKAGVPLVPGYFGAKQDFQTLSKAADKIGYPVLVKASAGGGGKGMRVVTAKDGLKDAVNGAKREAKASFGDDQLMIEKYLDRARHVEIQIFADSFGDVLHLFERDCSLQRRHQKVIEEAPAPGMTANVRNAMGQAAVDAARAVGYVGAGTVEFMFDGNAFYFIEMNTRLQVEHPVTELITGVDLVEWQLRVAAGAPLPMAQADLAINGHAFEARLYAEDPDKGYLPQTGTLQHLAFPDRVGIRIDTGVEPGDRVSVHYDPMIAKVIVHGPDRQQALAALRRALADTRIVGLATNLDFLIGICDSKPFQRAKIDTRWLDRLKAPKAGWRRQRAATSADLAAAAHFEIKARGVKACARAARSEDSHSPWFRTDGWRMIDRGHQDIHLADTIEADAAHLVCATARSNGGFDLVIDGVSFHASFEGLHVLEDDAGTLHVFSDEGRAVLALIDPAADDEDDALAGGGLTAPMPGKVTAVYVKAGDAVKRGAALLVLEAMKMEHTITAPADGKVAEVRYKAGDQVDEGAALVVFDA